MYDLVALSSAISNDGTGKLTADFDGQITYMQNDTTKENYELMYTVQEKTDTYTRYLISVSSTMTILKAMTVCMPISS